MADQIFTNATATVPGTVVTAPWLNDVNTAVYDRLTAVGGTLNALTATGPTGMTSYSPGQNFYFTPSLTNGGASTININALGVKNIVKANSIPLVASDLIAGQVHEISYDGTSFFLMNPGTYSGTAIPVSNGGTGATTAANALINLGATGRLIGVQVLTTNGTYTPTAGTTSILVEAMGASGGSAGSPATGAGQYAFGTPGGAGGYSKSRFTSGFSGVSYTVGVAGTAGAAGGNGGVGGNTTFLGITAGGGTGGSITAVSTSSIAGAAAPGVATGGNILNVTGPMGTGMTWASSPPPLTPPGASTIFGSGGAIQGGTGAATAGSGFGACGGWAFSPPSSAAQLGVAGRPGVIYVYEYA